MGRVEGKEWRTVIEWVGRGRGMRNGCMVGGVKDVASSTHKCTCITKCRAELRMEYYINDVCCCIVLCTFAVLWCVVKRKKRGRGREKRKRKRKEEEKQE
jgi:hypothetical protein